MKGNINKLNESVTSVETEKAFAELDEVLHKRYLASLENFKLEKYNPSKSTRQSFLKIEKIVYDRLNHHIQCNILLDPNQSA